MGVSLIGASGRSLTKILTTAAVLGLIGALAYYFYGPAVTPAFQGAAVAECNRITGGSYRAYTLQWVIDTRPHWLCGSRFEPADDPVNLGWWVTPTF